MWSRIFAKSTALQGLNFNAVSGLSSFTEVTTKTAIMYLSYGI